MGTGAIVFRYSDSCSYRWYNEFNCFVFVDMHLLMPIVCIGLIKQLIQFKKVNYYVVNVWQPFDYPLINLCTKFMFSHVHDSKKISILKKGIGIEGEKIIETS